MKDSYVFPRVQAIPQVGRASLCIDGRERVGYEFGEGMSRPFLFPFIGPAGALLTRMGHPNPIGHEHHKSVWFGHQNVAGINFWEEKAGTDIRIRHRRVVVYQDGADWGGLVVEWDWWAQGRSLLRQELTIAIEPGRDGGFALDLQSRFESPGQIPVELGRTNFGFLGVRLAKTMSERYGGGTVIDAQGSRGAASSFGQPSRWIDHAGPVAPGKIEGICVMDHPSNADHPVAWHVRDDGWLGPSFNRESVYGVAKDHALALRYRLLVHAGRADRAALDHAWEAFAATPAYEIVPPRGQQLASLERRASST
ncbi:MAG: PmoA family protein [Isosphaeraceae bacterium]